MDFMIIKTINICILIFSFYQTFVFSKYKKYKSIATLSFFWSLVLFFGIIINWELEINPISTVFIFLNLSMFYLGFLISDPRSLKWHCEITKKRFYLTSILCMCIGIFLVFLLLRSVGLRLSMKPDELVANAIQFSILRVVDPGLNTTFYSLTIYISLIPVMALAFMRENTAKTVFISALLPVCCTVLLSSKIIIFYYLCFLASVSSLNQNARLDFRKFLSFKWIIITALLIILVVFSFSLREGYNDIFFWSERDKLFYLLRGYLIGPLFGFSEFVDSFTTYNLLSMNSEIQQQRDVLTFGAYTMPIFIPDPSVNVMYPNSVEQQGYIQTNLYSVFRPLLQDFGMLGSSLYSLSIGVMLGILTKIKLGKLDIVRAIMIMVLTAAVMFGYLMTPLASGTFIGIFAFGCIVLSIFVVNKKGVNV